jgi:hypothetical protein
MASWTILDDQVFWISSRATAFTVVCSACAQLAVSDGYAAATVQGSLPLACLHGTVDCPRGHRLRIERRRS